MKIAVKKILRKHAYPPDMELNDNETVIEHAKLLATDFNNPKIFSINNNSENLVAAAPEREDGF